MLACRRPSLGVTSRTSKTSSTTTPASACTWSSTSNEACRRSGSSPCCRSCPCSQCRCRSRSLAAKRRRERVVMRLHAQSRHQPNLEQPRTRQARHQEASAFGKPRRLCWPLTALVCLGMHNAWASRSWPCAWHTSSQVMGRRCNEGPGPAQVAPFHTYTAFACSTNLQVLARRLQLSSSRRRRVPRWRQQRPGLRQHRRRQRWLPPPGEALVAAVARSSSPSAPLLCLLSLRQRCCRPAEEVAGRRTTRNQQVQVQG